MLVPTIAAIFSASMVDSTVLIVVSELVVWMAASVAVEVPASDWSLLVQVGFSVWS